MRDIELLHYKMHATLSSFQQKVKKAHQIIDDGMNVMSQPYLAYSGGIDSLVVLDMLFSRGYAYAMDVFWGDDGYDHDETLQFLKDTEARYAFTLKRARSMNSWRDWCIEMGRPDLCEDPESLQAWHNPHEWDYTWTSLQETIHYGYDGVFLGLLASESRNRNYALKGGSKPLYQVKSEGGMWHCSPLASWKKIDCMAYVASREIAYNPVYDKLAAMDIPLDKRRVAPLTCYRVLQYGSHSHILKSGWPSIYNKLAATFPSIR